MPALSRRIQLRPVQEFRTGVQPEHCKEHQRDHRQDGVDVALCGQDGGDTPYGATAENILTETFTYHASRFFIP